MEYYGLILSEDELTYKPDLESLSAKRAVVIQRVIDDFVEYYENEFQILVNPIDSAAIKLATLYYEICYREVKPLILDKVNRYKMASLMELLIVKLQILNHPESETNVLLNRELNAKFAMSVGFCLIECMIVNVKRTFHFDSSNMGVNDRVKKVLDDHELWLKTKNLNDIPVIINSQFLELLDVMLSASYEIH